MKLFKITALLGFCALLSCCATGVKTPESGGLKTQNLRITTDLPGWTEEAASFQTFTTVDQLAGDVGLDGEAYLYSNKGLTEGIYQKLTSRAGNRMELYILDFGSDAGAAAVFAGVAASQVSDAKQIGSMARSVAVVQDNNNSAVIYAHLGRLFFKLSMTDYGGAFLNATSAANLFLNFYKSKIGI
jgi:hypothetical protein